MKYSFDDEVVSKFSYDIDNKKIKIYFTGYTDLLKNQRLLDAPCAFVIEGWSEARSRLGDEKRSYDLDRHMGIFSMILSMEVKDEKLNILINTIDNRFVTYSFFGHKSYLCIF